MKFMPFSLVAFNSKAGLEELFRKFETLVSIKGFGRFLSSPGSKETFISMEVKKVIVDKSPKYQTVLFVE